MIYIYLVLSTINLAVCADISGKKAVSDPGDFELRRLDQFGSMITMETGRDAVDFNNYGNWCGAGGSGKPVDEIDNCCMHHDHCYDRLINGVCESWLNLKVYLLGYHWSDEDNKIVCTDDPQSESCKYQLCGCDRAGAMCFGKWNHVYKKKYKSKTIGTKIVDFFADVAMKIKTFLEKIFGL
ncbi:acidic phospholipase A2 PLA-1-like [Tubulanus polymorphus]|uniref:acidic phospholipase A2 PLA-1-like n=1 Tax=Tubulanus polymorphus TaxID=672921 RepID=UPI003DA3F7A5